MKPEPGDKSISVTRADVAAAVASVGVRRPDVVIFHSSLSSMGTVVGGPNTVINGFLDAVGPEGTVAVPTLCWSKEEPGKLFERWDPWTSPAYIGLIPETFRQRPDAMRSSHATHSVAAIGARADELTRDHVRAGPRLGPYGERAFGADSPWDKLYQWDAAHCFIGVDFTVNTMRHFIETLFVSRALDRAPAARRTALADRVQAWMKKGVWPDHRGQAMGERLAVLGLVTPGRIGSATLRCIRAKAMVDSALAILEREPQAWFNEEFLSWYRETIQSSNPAV